MKVWLRIPVLLLVYCLLTAKSCSNEEERRAAWEQERVVAVRDSLRAAFDSDSLAELSRRAYEGSAVQKLSDLSDYLNILSDTTLDPAFRQKTTDMAHGLFISDTVLLKSGAGEKIRERISPVAAFSGEIAAMNSYIFDSVRVVKRLTRVNDSTYAGQLSFLERGPDEPHGTLKSSRGLIWFIDIYAARRVTILGSDTLRTWKVLLGRISRP